MRRLFYLTFRAGKSIKLLATSLLAMLMLPILLYALNHFTFAQSEQGANLILNWGFEDPSPAHWYDEVFGEPLPAIPFWISGISREGEHSAGMVSIFESSWGRWASDNMPISRDIQYDFSGWIQGAWLSDRAYISLVFLDSDSQSEESVIKRIDSNAVVNTANWIKVSGSAVAPGNAKFARIECILSGMGIAWFDEIYLGQAESSAPFLIISKSASPDPATPGKSLVYTITYSNTGQAVANNTVITEHYDSHVDFENADPPPNQSNNIWTIGDVNSGDGGTIVITVTVSTGLSRGINTLDNFAEISSTKAKNSVTKTIRITSTAGAQIYPTHTISSVSSLPCMVTYTHIVTNTGDLKDTICLTATPASPLSASVAPECDDLEPGEGVVFTVYVTVPHGTPPGKIPTYIAVTSQSGTLSPLPNALDETEIVSSGIYIPLVMKDYWQDCQDETPCDWDLLEPNNEWCSAHPISSNVPIQSYICAPGDTKDYYRIEITTLNPISIDLTDIPPETDYDLYLYDFEALQQQKSLAKSAHFENRDEHITYQPLHTGIYFIRVCPYGGWSTSPYTLRVTFD